MSLLLNRVSISKCIAYKTKVVVLYGRIKYNNAHDNVIVDNEINHDGNLTIVSRFALSFETDDANGNAVYSQNFT